MTREEHREKVLAAVRRQAVGELPDFDWAPMLLLDAGRVVMMIPPEVLPLSLSDEMHVALTRMAGAYDAQYFARIMSVWMLDPPEGAPPPTAPGAAMVSPDRYEAVMVLLGDAEDMEAVAAMITRGPGPPELGEWQVTTRSENA